MKKIISLILLLFAQTYLFAANNCESFTYNKSQCEFNFPAVSNGEIQSSEFSDERYSGISIAKCINGKYAIKKSVCEPKQKNTCDYVSPTTWNNGNISCSHGTKELNLKEGERQKVFSTENNGHRTYECFNGRLQGIEQECNKQEVTFAPKATTETACTFDVNNYYNEDRYGSGVGGNSYCYTDVVDISYAGAEISFQYEERYEEGGECRNEGLDVRFTGLSDYVIYAADSSKVLASSGSGSTVIRKYRGYLDIEGYGKFEMGVKKEDLPSGGKHEICHGQEKATQCTNYNTASVSRTAGGYEVTKCFVDDQSNSTIEGLCSNITTPTVYDSHTSAQANGGTTYNVSCIESNEICPSNTTKTEIGSRTEAEKSGLAPYYCEGDVCYYCKDNTPKTVSGLCATCDMNSVTFSSNDNKNGSCTVNLGGEEVYSGDTKNKEFFNSIYHGQVSYFCMNGNSEVKSETCYLNCNAKDISWSDEGATSYYLGLDKTNACQERIDRKSRFKNKERSEVLTSTTNTGNAIFYCNGYNGEWVMEEERCKLDCPSVAYWPDNTQENLYDRVGREKGYNAFNGDRKAFACSYNFGSAQKHGKTATVSSNGMNKGSATLECKDGYWEVQSQSCNLHCDKATPAITLSKNGRTCTFNSDRPDKTAHNGVVGGFSNDDVRNNGTINWRCNNGEWDVESYTCEPKTCGDNAYWSDSTSGCIDTTMSGTEGELVAAVDSSFPSSGGPTGNASFRCKGYSVTDPNGKWVKEGSSTCWTSYDGKCNSLSYLSSAPSEGQACERNFGSFSVGTSGNGTSNEKYTWRCNGKTLGSDDTGCSAYKAPQCGSGYYDCNIGSVENKNIGNSTTAYWSCKNGSKTTSCSKSKTSGTNASCSTTNPESCSSGTFSDLADDGYEWNWRCNGSALTSTKKAGSNARCSLNKPRCGSSLYTCSNGSTKTSETTGHSTTASWTCSAYGSDKSCSGAKFSPSSNGSCGTSKNSCTSGTLNDLSDSSDYYRWKCLGSDATKTRRAGTDSGICTARKPVNGSCGSADGVSTRTAPSSGLCSSGSASSVSTGSNSYTWTCSGSYGGSNDSCSAPKQSPAIDGKCGTVVGTCDAGVFTPRDSTQDTEYWACEGTNGGSTAECSYKNQKEVCCVDMGNPSLNFVATGSCPKGKWSQQPMFMCD